MVLDFNLIVTVLALAVTLSVTLLIYLAVAPVLDRRARLRRRIEQVARGSAAAPGGQAGRQGREGARRREIQARLREAEERGRPKESRATRYRKMLRQAGVEMSLQRFLVLCSLLGTVAAALYVAFGYPPVFALPVAITVGFGLPRFWLKRMKAKREKQFTLRFADAVDVIVRGIRSGLPVGECLNIIARESPSPVDEVFRQLVESQRLGLTTEQALERAQESMSTSELKFFGIVLTIQQQTGGNLAETLSNLSNILRARKKMTDKVKSLSSEARSSAMIIGSLPFLMTALLWLVNPEYINLLFTDRLGNILILAGLGWMSIGVFIMRQMINFEI